jgi:hypothetical protein
MMLRDRVRALMVETRRLARPRDGPERSQTPISDVRTSPNCGSGVECRGSKTQSRQRVFYPVFTPGDDDGMLAALNPVPERRPGHARFGDRKPGKAGAIDSSWRKQKG